MFLVFVSFGFFFYVVRSGYEFGGVIEPGSLDESGGGDGDGDGRCRIYEMI